MAKYCWTFLWQILCTVFFSWTWSGVIDSNNPKCADNEFGYKSPSGQLICKPCVELPKCANGLGVSVACGNIANTHVECLHCVLGKNFSAVYDSLPCEPCQSTVCHENEEIIGSCKVDKDTSKCSGVCKKGFYSIDGNLNNCQPCSLCLNNASARLVKCKDDGLPVEKQCEVGLIVTPVFPTKKKLPLKERGEKHIKSGGYQFYGHPVLFSFFLIIFVFAGILTFVILRRKFRKKTQSPVIAPNQITNNNDDSGGDVETTHVSETHDHYDGSSPVLAVDTVRRRKSSSGSGGPRISFSRQISSNSNNGLDFSGESSVQPPATVDELLGENDVFEEKASERKRTLSGSSEKRGRFFGRQNSNPAKEQDEEKPFQRRSSTFGNFSTLFSGEKTGTKDEKASLLTTDHNDNDIFPDVVALPSESSSEPHRLSGLKIGDLNAEIHRQLCVKLNQDVPKKDWQTLAGRMNCTCEQAEGFAGDKNPTKKLLDFWGTDKGNDVACLIEHLKAMDRNDLVELLESERNPKAKKFYF